jgi:hypothetical protein
VKPTDPDHLRLLDRHVEDDTRIFFAKFVRVGGIPILLERWSSDGLTGKTAVLLNRDVAGMDDAALRALLEKMAGIALTEPVTVKREKIHVFVNFGFEVK